MLTKNTSTCSASFSPADDIARELEHMYWIQASLKLNTALGIDVREEIIIGHLNRLTEIVTQYGWPTISMVGKRASAAALNIVLDAAFLSESKVDVAEHLLLRMKEVAHDITATHIPLLTDRIAREKGVPQKFGTQFCRDETTGLLTFWEIEDEEHAEVLRQKAGMPSLKEAIEQERSTYQKLNL